MKGREGRKIEIGSKRKLERAAKIYATEMTSTGKKE